MSEFSTSDGNFPNGIHEYVEHRGQLTEFSTLVTRGTINGFFREIASKSRNHRGI